MPERRVGGMIFFDIQGEIYKAKGSFTYNLGRPKREAVVGMDRVHGFKEMPQVAYIEGVITDDQELDLERLVTVRDVLVTLRLANGKTVGLRDAWYAGEGQVTTEDGEIAVRFEGMDAEESR